ncbi:hypothetical protein HAV15_011593 [Penicillium sp. str. |uniref:Genomic scaffold, ProqFM164S02 n=1 Tax=Penicillium roqueforti (strain FM164) TaxID=1365484 RepID=W6QEB8_PENRF|nr:hypothetical protein HAV15_011593 [Penicillium sp. str. \
MGLLSPHSCAPSQIPYDRTSRAALKAAWGDGETAAGAREAGPSLRSASPGLGNISHFGCQQE